MKDNKIILNQHFDCDASNETWQRLLFPPPPHVSYDYSARGWPTELFTAGITVYEFKSGC